jgi:hypothetical protein
MALHIRCFEVKSDGGTLFAVMQYGQTSTKGDPEFGVQVRLSRRHDRKGSVEHPIGTAGVNIGCELVRIPEGVSASEIADLERQIKELAA